MAGLWYIVGIIGSFLLAFSDHYSTVLDPIGTGMIFSVGAVMVIAGLIGSIAISE